MDGNFFQFNTKILRNYWECKHGEPQTLNFRKILNLSSIFAMSTLKAWKVEHGWIFQTISCVISIIREFCDVAKLLSDHFMKFSYCRRSIETSKKKKKVNTEHILSITKLLYHEHDCDFWWDYYDWSMTKPSEIYSTFEKWLITFIQTTKYMPLKSIVLKNQIFDPQKTLGRK